MKHYILAVTILTTGCASFSQPQYNSDGTVQRISYEDTTPNRAPPKESAPVGRTFVKWLVILTSIAANSASETIRSQTYFPNANRNVVHDVNELSGRGSDRRDTYVRLLNAKE